MQFNLLGKSCIPLAVQLLANKNAHSNVTTEVVTTYQGYSEQANPSCDESLIYLIV